MKQTIDNEHGIPSDWDRSGLPGWAYFSEDLFELEQEVLFRQHWQLVGHVNSIKEKVVKGVEEGINKLDQMSK